MKKLFLIPFFSFFIFLLSLSNGSLAQDSCHLRISLLTCAPGEELYSTFGHTALRVQDSANNTDLVFNYGTFEFGPDFYTKFIKGSLLYFLSVESFSDFMYEYHLESRSVQEQVLQLTCAEKEKLFAALQLNAQDQNKYYRYNFLFDNCTTRAKDIVAKNTNSPVVFKNILPKDVPTFRDLIHSYLDSGHEYWSKLGIDILLGAKLDKKVSNEQAMFLPDYLLKGFDSAVVDHRPLVASRQTILQMPSLLKEKSFFTPGIAFSLLLISVIIISFVGTKWARTTLLIFDFLFLFLLGSAGILLLFMWFGTDHKVCQNNYNLLWALPTNIVMAFFVHSNKRWVKNYFKIVFFINLLLLIAWFFLPQQMNNALIAVCLLVFFRSLSLTNIKPHAGKNNQHQP